MAGSATDTTILTITVNLPDGGVLRVTGENDGVNGFEWSASLAPNRDPRRLVLPCDVEERMLVGGIYDQDEVP